MKAGLRQAARIGILLAFVAIAAAMRPVSVAAAPYAAMVIDARTGKVLHSRNADTRLHPASLTKMMTLYLVFQAVEHGDISLDQMVTISANAAAEPPSKLGLKAGQRIKLRYLIRAAAIKSANDAATALAEAVAGSEAAFVQRMNRMARAMGMSRTTFRNASGLTSRGHLSTARDMTTLGRHLLYDFPQYYNLFSRRSADAGVRVVNNTNRRLLNSYTGADGIKTGYTAAAGYNLVASARRGNERIIATVFGGRSAASRNAKVAELLDLGFRRAPSNARPNPPPAPPYFASGAPPPPAGAPAEGTRPPAGHVLRVVTAVATSPRPRPRPDTSAPAPSPALLAAIEDGVENVLEGSGQGVPQDTEESVAAVAAPPPARPPAVAKTAAPAAEAPVFPPPPRPQQAAQAAQAVALAAARPGTAPAPEIVTHVSTSGDGSWGIDVGLFTTRAEAERVLLQVALGDLGMLGNALRKPARRPDGWHATFVGMSEEAAGLACRRLKARARECSVIGPG